MESVSRLFVQNWLLTMAFSSKSEVYVVVKEEARRVAERERAAVSAVSNLWVSSSP